MSAAGVLALSACAQPPISPTVLALPRPGKPFAQFQQEDAGCRNYAQSMTAGQAEAANQRAVGTAALGTLLGAAGGAVIGGAFGNAGAGAAIGAGTGLTAGGAYGANGAAAAQFSIQQRYDIAYTQCMYANGNSVQAAPYGYGYLPAYPAPPVYYPAYP
ncbi:MAG: glycine zipper family protein [Acidisphaera sp.]|nr:glycine zipper family protein [Acidisphaera sp.]